MSKVVIITTGTSAKAQSISKKYQQSRVVFADSAPVPAPLLETGKFLQLPPVTAHHFIHELLKSCLDQQADLLILLSEEEIRTVLPQKQLFSEYNIELVC